MRRGSWDEEESRTRSLWSLVALLLVLVLIVGGAIWWLESRFGSLVAIGSLGLLAGAVFFILGASFASALTRGVLGSANDFVDRLVDAQKAQQGTARVYAQMERDAARVALRAETIDAQRVDRLAAQQARLLQAPADEDGPTWMTMAGKGQDEEVRIFK